ncbi:hypothetical protein Tco_0098138 [Tanacetum coccineum]
MKSMGDKKVSTITDHDRMEATLKDMMINQFKDAEDYAYHIEQATNYMENQIVWESSEEDLMILEKEATVFDGPQRDPNEPPRYLYNTDLFYLKHENTETNKYVLSLHKIHATPFPENDLKEQLTRWVQKGFKTFNKEARLSIQHWKQTWHKIVYINKHKKERDDNKAYIFSEADFKYMNKDDIEYMYYLCLNGKVKYRDNGLLNSLVINLTVPTLTLPGIHILEPYSIITKPFMGIVYENSKKEKNVTGIREIPKFCDATLEKVLKKVSMIICMAHYKLKIPSLGELNKDIIGLFEKEIKKRLKHRRHIRRWEIFMNGSPNYTAHNVS